MFSTVEKKYNFKLFALISFIILLSSFLFFNLINELKVYDSNIKQIETSVETLLINANEKNNFKQIIHQLNTKNNENYNLLYMVWAGFIGIIFLISYLIKKDILDNFKQLNLKTIEDNQQIQVLLDDIDKNVIASSTDLRGRITHVTDAFCKISGFSKEELLGQAHNIVRSEYMAKEDFKDLWQTVQNGDIWKGIVQNKRKNGSYYWVESTVSPIFRDGIITGYTSIRQNITARKELQQVNQNIELVLDNVDNGLLVFDDKFLICEGYSKNSLKFFNQTNLENKNIAELLFNNDLKEKNEFIHAIDMIFNTQDEDQVNLYIELLQNKLHLNNKLFTLKYKKVGIDKIMIIMKDITSRENLQKKLYQEIERNKMIVMVAGRKNEFMETRTQFYTFLSTLENDILNSKNIDETITSLLTTLHTFKGIFLSDELINIPKAIHEVEEILLSTDTYHCNKTQLLEDILSINLKLALQKDINIIESVLGINYFSSLKMLNIEEKSFKLIEERVQELSQNPKISKKSLKI